MSRIGLSPDHLAALTLGGQAPPARYAAQTEGLRLLEGETVALVGTGTGVVLDVLADELADCAWVDGSVAAQGGALRIHAQQAARVGLRALAITNPFDQLAPPAKALAVADLAGLRGLGLTVVAEAADPVLAALFADRIAVVVDGRPVVAYPVLAPCPRRPHDVRPVAARVEGRLAAHLG